MHKGRIAGELSAPVFDDSQRAAAQDDAGDDRPFTAKQADAADDYCRNRRELHSIPEAGIERTDLAHEDKPAERCKQSGKQEARNETRRTRTPRTGSHLFADVRVLPGRIPVRDVDDPFEPRPIFFP